VINDHISVCVSTFRRNELLERLLKKLALQETQSLFTFSVVVVDNDAAGPAGETVMRLGAELGLDVVYGVEPERSIPAARNRAISLARGNYIATIDDDEYPTRQWLLHLYKTINSCKSDGALGPVLPYFEKKPPKWVLKGQFFDRPLHFTGYILNWKNTRTGNSLLKKELFEESDLPFDPAFASGGEDRDFFRRKIEEGHVFVWCNEAPVFEFVPATRWKRAVLVKRGLLRGKMALNDKERSRLSSILKSAAAITLYAGCLPLAFIIGHHVFMKYLIKAVDHLGKIAAFFGINLVKETYVSH
jgi:succinoglycan biosynthesis protein ExoM